MPENIECRKILDCRKKANAGKQLMPKNGECRSKVNRNKLSRRIKDDIRDLLSRVRIDVLEKFRKNLGNQVLENISVAAEKVISAR